MFFERGLHATSICGAVGAAAFSRPYTVAAALLGGGLDVSHEDFTAFPALLRVTTRTGEELEARVEVNRGGPGPWVRVA